MYSAENTSAEIGAAGLTTAVLPLALSSNTARTCRSAPTG